MRRPRGFVLVAVLAMLVILSLLAGTIGLVTQRVRDEQMQRQRLMQASIDMASTRASVVYLLLTQRMTIGGLTVDDRIVLSEDEKAAARRGEGDGISLMPTGSEVSLDGTPYLGTADIRFSLQDDRGLSGVGIEGGVGPAREPAGRLGPGDRCDDAAAFDAALQALAGFFQKLRVTRAYPFVKQHDVVLHRSGNSETEPHPLTGRERPQPVNSLFGHAGELEDGSNVGLDRPDRHAHRGGPEIDVLQNGRIGVEP